MLQVQTPRDRIPSLHINDDNRVTFPKLHSETVRRLSSRAPTRSDRRDRLKFGNKHESPERDELLDDGALFSRLQKIFNKKEEEEDSGLPIDEFKDAMRRTVCRNSTEDEIELLFMKVDANCDGQVDWEEYVTYNLLEYKEKTLMMETLRERPFPNEIREIESRHRDVIVKILFYPSIRKTGSKNCEIERHSGKYLTLSKEGLLGIWNLKMRNLKYHNANHYKNRNTQPWFTDMVAMYNVNMIAITTTDRDLTIFDLNGKTIAMRYYVTGFENCITAMDYWVNPADLNKALLLFGDTSGNVLCIRFETCMRGGPFGSLHGKKTCKKISYPEIARGFVIGVKSQKLANIHEDWVNKVMYLPGIECILSSCQSAKTGLFFGDFSGKKSHVYFRVNKGVLCFDYSNLLNIIVTGGMDYLLRVWNPYVNNKAIMLLKGHTKPVNHVIINDTKNQVISIDKGRSLRVYDLRDQSCLQQISGRIIKFDNYPISAVNFQPRMRTILLAATQIIMLEKREEEEATAEVVTHNKPLASALYSKVFNTVISACQESVVSVWDSNTGDKLMQFMNAHSTLERGMNIPVEITTMCFDYNGRRLLTGARNGTVHVWNYNNGSLMQSFKLPDNSSVTGIVASRHNFYVTGWGKAVYIYIDGEGEEHIKQWRIQHNEDVLCIAALAPNIIATGSYDGDVIIWSRDTGQVNCRLNAFESAKPVGEYNAHRNKLIQQAEELEINTPVEASLSTDSESSPHQEQNHWTKRRTRLTTTIGLLARARGDTVEDTCEHPLLHALDKSYVASDKATYSRDDYDNVCKRYESAVEKILFLENRESNRKDTAALVTSGAEGWIRFWSMHHDGGLLGQYNGAHRLGESILTITTDTSNNFLVTGDTQGYVKIWDIKDYCVSKKMTLADRLKHLENLKKKFTFFRVESYHTTKKKFSVTEYLKNIFASRPPPTSSEPGRTLRYPPLINSFRAHTRPIHTVDLVWDRNLLITASSDCSVRLWTVNGQYIGTFGGEKWASLPKVITNDYFLSQIPGDIRRSGSAKTLKVMHGGQTPRWQSAFTLLRHRGVERLKKQFEHLRSEDEQEEESDDGEDLETSNILGKSYKRTTRHKIAPRLPKFIETPGSVAVYHALPFVDLAPLDAMNDDMRELQDRRACTVALNRLRGIQTRKQNVPAIVSLFNKVVTKKGPVVKKIQVGRMKKVVEKFHGPQGTQSKSTSAVAGRGKTGKANRRNTDSADSRRLSSVVSPLVKDSKETEAGKETREDEHEDATEEDSHLDTHYFQKSSGHYMTESHSNVKSVSFVYDV